MIAVLALLAGMALLSLVHELGHAIAAVLFGMHITDVCIGLGPPLLGIERRGIRFFVAPIPLGGFVRVAELSPDPYGHTDAQNRASEGSILGRALVVAAGPAANYLFAGTIALAIALGWGIDTGKSSGLKVASADAGAARAGLVVGDLVSRINGRKVRDLRSLSEALAATDAEEDAVVEVQRSGVLVQLRIPRLRSRAGGFGLGAAYTIEPQRRRVGPGEALAHAAEAPIAETRSLMVEAATALWAKDSAKARPLGIVGLADRVHAANSWTGERVLQLGMSLSVAMGLFNLLPFPGLDGGRLCIEAAQAVLRRRLPARWIVAVQIAGGLILLAAWLLLTAFEIYHL